MVLHELATNAAKYGALSVPTGRVEVRWRRDGPEGRLSLQWRETGGPTVQPPAAEGFGVQLIRRTVAYDLDGEVMIGYEPAGLVGELVFPLSHEAHLGRTAS
jgi:two-component sensor histidine kinase